MLSKQDKKKAEADRQKELNDLFAIAIKQPKVPPGTSPTSLHTVTMKHTWILALHRLA